MTSQPPQGLTLITPTSDRRLAFALCERWMARQTYQGPLQWIVVDDGTRPVQATCGQDYVRREPSATPLESFLGNLSTALQRVEYDRVLVIEDDDWYAPDYCEVVSRSLEAKALVGESGARYYNIWHRLYRTINNEAHASLCQTGFRSDVAQWLLGELKGFDSFFVDSHLWKNAPVNQDDVLLSKTDRSVGIKGIPGKKGLGLGHRPRRKRFGSDPDGTVLTEWVGTDAKTYFDLIKPIPYSLPQRLLDRLSRNLATPDISREEEDRLLGEIREKVSLK